MQVRNSSLIFRLFRNYNIHCHPIYTSKIYIYIYIYIIYDDLTSTR